MVRRPTPSNLAASVSDSPSDFRHFAKSAPDIGNCSSAIRRRVDPDRSRWPHFVSTGQATPRPSSTISILANMSASSMSGAKCWLRAIKPVKSSTYSRRSPAKRTRSLRSPLGWAFFTIGMSLVIPFTFSESPLQSPVPGLVDQPALLIGSRSALRLNTLCILRLKLASRHLHIIMSLQVHPELGTIAEVQAQAERGVCSNASTIGNDVGDPVWRNPKCLRELILRKAVFSQKFLLYHFARSHWC